MADQTLAQSGAVSEVHPSLAGRPMERIVPGEAAERLYPDHLERYRFASRFVEGRVVLDVACGVGYGAPILHGAGARRYIGVDISPEAIGVAEERYRCSPGVSFRVGDACRLSGIGDASIDVAISFETIEHLAEPGYFLANLRRVLAPGGLLIISTPNRTLSNPLGNLDSAPGNPFHIREWNPKEFEAFLKSSFKVEQSLGQAPLHFARALWTQGKALILRQTREHRHVEWFVTTYRTAMLQWTKHPSPGSAYDAPVQSIKPWQCRTFIVCVCKPLPFARR